MELELLKSLTHSNVCLEKHSPEQEIDEKIRKLIYDFIWRVIQMLSTLIRHNILINQYFSAATATISHQTHK